MLSNKANETGIFRILEPPRASTGPFKWASLQANRRFEACGLFPFKGKRGLWGRVQIAQKYLFHFAIVFK